MNYSTTLLDAMIERQKLPSDNRAAQLLGLTRGAICNVRAGRRNLSPDQILKAAKLAGIRPEVALLRATSESIEDLEMRHYLEKITEEIQGVREAS